MCIAPAIVLVTLEDSVMDAFSLVAGVSSVLYLSVWGLILVCYLKYLGKIPNAMRNQPSRCLLAV